MDLFSVLQTTVQNELTVGSESTLFPLDTVKLAINRAYRKAGGLFRWPSLEDAKKTSTVSSQEYYDYPDTWRPDSIWKLVVDTYDYGDPVVFKDYLYEKEQDIPSGATYLWANQWRRFFIYPTPTSTGSNNISIWGVKNVETLTSDSDVTIFSYSMPECNEAIVLEAVAILRSKGEDDKGAMFKSAQAQQILTTSFMKIKQENAKYEKTQPFFSVPDYFADQGKKQNTGNFD
jgi:hypothetical protein